MLSISTTYCFYEEAKALVCRGWALLPCFGIDSDLRCDCGNANCKSPGKHPLTKNGVKDATKDLVTIREWVRRYPNANIGVATGCISGVFVVDQDVKPHLSIDGCETLSGLEKTYNKLPTTLEVQTGSGGRHTYFIQPAGVVIPTVGGLLEGIDIRGDGGYVVAPPSKHASGRSYTWDPTDDVAIADAPHWLLQLLSRKSTQKSKSASEWDSIVANRGFGGRHEALLSIAGAVLGAKISPKVAYSLLWAFNLQSFDPPLERSDFDALVDRVARREFSKRNLRAGVRHA